jgi:lipopolysaccharide transport system permease protein
MRAGIANAFRDLLDCRELAWQLMRRDLKAQYRQALLGFAWAFVIPVANIAAWLLIHSAGIINTRGTGMSYASFVISGTILWSVFMDGLNAPLQKAMASKQMLAKINFHREAIILSGLGQVLFNSLVKMAVLLIALAIIGLSVTPALALLPVFVAAFALLGTAAGLVLVPPGLLYADIGRGLPLVTQFLMFLCPVVYPIPNSGPARLIMNANPLTHLLEATRRTLRGESPTDGLAMAGVALIIIATMGIGWWVYRKAMPVLIERMG